MYMPLNVKSPVSILNLGTCEMQHPEDSAMTSSKLLARVLMSKAAKTKAYSMSHDGIIFLIGKNTQDTFLSRYQPTNEEIWVLCTGHLILSFNGSQKNVRIKVLNDNKQWKNRTKKFQLTATRGNINRDSNFYFVTYHLLADKFSTPPKKKKKVSFSIKKKDSSTQFLHVADRKDWFLGYSIWKQVKSCFLGVEDLHVILNRYRVF